MKAEELYNMLVYIGTYGSEGNEQVRRMSNILAVKSTWRILNNPSALLDVIKGYKLLKGDVK